MKQVENKINFDFRIESLLGEYWVDLFGYEGIYQISNLGRVKRLSITNKGSFYKEKIVCVSMDSKSGYLSMSLSDGQKRSNLRLHVAIASSFIPNPLNLSQVNHINGIRNDNRIENLEWITPKDNIIHSVKYLRKNKKNKSFDLKLNEKYIVDKVLDLDGEVWHDVVGYEGIYKISNLNRVKTVPRKFINKSNKIRTIREKLLCTYYRSGYLNVSLFKDGKVKNKGMHVLISQVFIENPENKPCVNHINGNRADNRLENLEWVTYSENAFHSHRFLKRKSADYENMDFPNQKKVAQYDLNGVFLNKFKSLSQASKISGIHASNISASCIHYEKTGRLKKCKKFTFISFEKEPPIYLKPYSRVSKIKISVFDAKTHELVFISNSIKDVAKRINGDDSTIYKIIKGKGKSHLGYYFKKEKNE